MLPIQTGTANPLLRTPSEAVKQITKRTLELIGEMTETMLAEKGVGIAAPQVGADVRIFLAMLDGKRLTPMINPEILNHSESVSIAEEGCLSLPGEWGQVERFDWVTMRYLDVKGKENNVKLSGFDARIVQHELDHLDGVLFTDHVKKPEANFLALPKVRGTERF